MSAILGRVNFDSAPISTEDFQSAFRMMAAYGGDGSGICVEGNVGLGQHLLRVTPESAYEQQPHAWDNAIIVADARIDNRNELCDHFQLSPEERAVTPDSHLILRAYHLWKDDCTAHLLGDFAFGIWDQRNQRVFCARDHIGVRPLYYYHTLSSFVFATDMRALQAFPDLPFEIDELRVASYLFWPFYIFDNKKTFFKQIQSLQPGLQIVVDAAGLHQRTHWSPDDAPDIRYKTTTEYTEHFRALLETAVAARVRTSFPIGAHISGGLDSSGIAVLANRQLRQQGRSLDMTYTWSPAKSEKYPEVKGDERNRIEVICQQEDIPCHYGAATGQDARGFLARDMAVEPIADLWEEIPVITHAGERGIRTILSGWGGDEAATFAGRGYFAFLLKRGKLVRLIQNTRQIVGIRQIRRIARFWGRHVILPLLPDRVWDSFDPYYRSDRQTLYLHPGFAQRFSHVAQYRSSIWREIADPREMQVRLLQNGFIADRMATWAVWSSAHNLLHTYPLTDRRILDFSIGLPPELLYQKRTTRYLYRESLKDMLQFPRVSSDVVNERKRQDLRLECWQILAEEVRSGQWSDHDVPWLDLDRLRASMLAVPEEMTREQLHAFIALFPAVRVWHLWQRYGDTDHVYFP